MRLLLIISTLLFISACDVAVDVDTGENKYCEPYQVSEITDVCVAGDRVTFYLHYNHANQDMLWHSRVAQHIAMYCDHRKEIVVTKTDRTKYYDETSTLHSVNCVYKPAERRTFQETPKGKKLIESQEAPFGKDED